MAAPRPTDLEDPVLTTRATARLLGVAVSTAQLWIESGTLAAWKTPGGHRRVRLSSVTRLLAARGVGDAEIDAAVGAEAAGAAPPAAAAASDPASDPASATAPDTAYNAAPDPEFLPALAPAYPVPADEAARLAALAATRLVDTAPEPRFDRLTWLATQVSDTPMAMISLLTASRQWFKSRSGVALEETPRQHAFCSHAILQDAPLVVEDASADARFRANPLVTGAPHIRFYAGVPLLDADGHRLGTLCVLDREPRRLRERELRALHELAAIASAEIQRGG